MALKLVKSQSKESKVAEVEFPGGEKVGVMYREPTNDERIAYRAAMFRRLGKKGKAMAEDSFKAALHFGKAVITGLRDGDFLDEEGGALSSTPGAPGYREDWKELLAEAQPDVVTIVASIAFDGVRVAPQAEDAEGDDGPF